MAVGLRIWNLKSLWALPSFPGALITVLHRSLTVYFQRSFFLF
jgi:hypothetical protein